MQSPFRNTDKSVERASRIISGLCAGLIVLLDATMVVGWQLGELQERLLVPGQVLAAYSVSQVERWAETMEDSSDSDTETANEPQNWEKYVNVTVTGNGATSVTTSTNNGSTSKTTSTTKTYTQTPAEPQPQQNNAGTTYTFTNREPSYSPPAWFVESSVKSQTEFEAKSQQNKAEFDAYAAQSKVDFEAAKAVADQ